MARTDNDRDRRLTEALRLNLRRRKDQAREAEPLSPSGPPAIKPPPEQP